MALHIVSPKNSFIQFAESDSITGCGVESFSLCLPVLNDDDIAFQFIIQADTSGEADILCDRANDQLTIGICLDCSEDTILDFSGLTSRSRISPTQVLFNWSHGVPGFQTVISHAECFHIKIKTSQYAETYEWCSNCLQRITDGCFTSVVDYTGADNQFGFDYCGGAAVTDSEETCEPTIINFTNETSLNIPYTAQLQAKYGDVPTVQTWIYNEAGELQQMGIREAFDGFPPTTIKIGLGDVSSGIVKIS